MKFIEIPSRGLGYVFKNPIVGRQRTRHPLITKAHLEPMAQMSLKLALLTLKVPITTYIICLCHLPKYLASCSNSVGPDQTALVEQSDLGPHCLPHCNILQQKTSTDSIFKIHYCQ